MRSHRTVAPWAIYILFGCCIASTDVLVDVGRLNELGLDLSALQDASNKINSKIMLLLQQRPAQTSAASNSASIEANKSEPRRSRAGRETKMGSEAIHPIPVPSPVPRRLFDRASVPKSWYQAYLSGRKHCGTVSSLLGGVDLHNFYEHYYEQQYALFRHKSDLDAAKVNTAVR
jgi:hypothetical protein